METKWVFVVTSRGRAGDQWVFRHDGVRHVKLNGRDRDVVTMM